MPKISETALREVQFALGKYRAELDGSDLALNTESSHYQGAKRFERWLADNCEVGEGLRQRNG